eukprot:Skav214170  [mRNA]  locus=scaffold945:251569:255626:- [translate_table: standard]
MVPPASLQVMDQMKYNVSTKELRDLETEAWPKLETGGERAEEEDPRGPVGSTTWCKSKAEDALAEALGIPEGKSRPTVIMRPGAMTADPGNDLEAVVDVEAPGIGWRDDRV